MELLFLLLPVAALSGWLLGRKHVKPEGKINRQGIPDNYFQGLSYLLNEEQDKAMDVFVKMLESNSETVELHLALANLFRQKGEVERSIRIHQNLIARPTLSRKQRDEALFELGQDYLKAGLLDRAEKIFFDIHQRRSYQKPAMENLLMIYQQEKDWDKAIETAERLSAYYNVDNHIAISHYFCELAEESIRNGEHNKASKYFKNALHANKACVRANLLDANVALEQHNYKHALKMLMRVVEQDKVYLAEVVEPIVLCFKEMGKRREIVSYLEKVMPEYGDKDTAILLSNEMLEDEDRDVAIAYLMGYLSRHPSFKVLKQLSHILVTELHMPDNQYCKIFDLTLDRLLNDVNEYKCINCGFSGKILHWQCPSCHQWETVKPISNNSI